MPVISAKDFMYSKNHFEWLQGTPHEIAVHGVWTKIRQPFLLPQSICRHTVPDAISSRSSTWEVYDINLAGCKQCGCMHVCNDGICEVVKSREGHNICVVTGMCVKMLSFCNEEFVDTACMDDCQSAEPMFNTGISNNDPRSNDFFATTSSGVVADAMRRGGKKRVGGGADSTAAVSQQKKQPRCGHNIVATNITTKALVTTTTTAVGGSRALSSMPRMICTSNGGNNNNNIVGMGSISIIHNTTQSRGGAGGGGVNGGGMGVICSSEGISRCSVNKKNRYRSWVYHRIMHRTNLLTVSVPSFQPHNNYMPLPPSSSSSSSSHWGARAAAAAAAAVLPVAFAPKASSDDSAKTRSLIQSYVGDVLCSSRWGKSMLVEEKKMRAKKRSLVLKVFKMLKAKSGGTSMISIPEAVRHVACMMGCVRTTRPDASEEERHTISDWCVETIHRHICLVNEVCKGIITDSKLKATTIGLLYMIRHGIIVHELVVLPKLPALEGVLPLESHLDPIFGVKAKCITETENVVKIIFRSITKQQLINAGVARAACQL